MYFQEMLDTQVAGRQELFLLMFTLLYLHDVPESLVFLRAVLVVTSVVLYSL